ATYRPSGLTTGEESEPAALPLRPTLTNEMVPVARLKTKLSVRPFASLGTRLSASLAKAMSCPSAEIEGAKEAFNPPMPYRLGSARASGGAVRRMRSSSRSRETGSRRLRGFSIRGAGCALRDEVLPDRKGNMRKLLSENGDGVAALRRAPRTRAPTSVSAP